MMLNLRLVMLFTAAILVFGASTALPAGATQCQWSLTDWDCAKNTIHPGVPMLDVAWEWDSSWPVTTSDKPEHVYVLYGPAPDPNDPDVQQVVRNRSQVPWTDWHVSISNGIYTSGSAVVYNQTAPSPQWVIEEFEDGSGFFAHVVSGMGTQVDYYETLYIFFSYTVIDPNQQVSITEYPTSTYMIPEPAAMMSLLAGCFAFGFKMRKRA